MEKSNVVQEKKDSIKFTSAKKVHLFFLPCMKFCWAQQLFLFKRNLSDISKIIAIKCLEKIQLIFPRRKKII